MEIVRKRKEKKVTEFYILLIPIIKIEDNSCILLNSIYFHKRINLDLIKRITAESVVQINKHFFI